jgi:hypothetical protein
MARANVKGTLYLLCFPDGLQSRPGVFARHYLGWTGNGVEQRLAEHLSGQGSPLIKAAIERGMIPELVRTWERATRNDERKLKRSKNLPRLCPHCNERITV